MLVWHALVDFWPSIAAVYSAMARWPWLGAGGTVRVVLAARYERRIGDLRCAAVRIAALR